MPNVQQIQLRPNTKRQSMAAGLMGAGQAIGQGFNKYADYQIKEERRAEDQTRQDTLRGEDQTRQDKLIADAQARQDELRSQDQTREDKQRNEDQAQKDARQDRTDAANAIGTLVGLPEDQRPAMAKVMERFLSPEAWALVDAESLFGIDSGKTKTQEMNEADKSYMKGLERDIEATKAEDAELRAQLEGEDPNAILAGDRGTERWGGMFTTGEDYTEKQFKIADAIARNQEKLVGLKEKYDAARKKAGGTMGLPQAPGSTPGSAAPGAAIAGSGAAVPGSGAAIAGVMGSPLNSSEAGAPKLPLQPTLPQPTFQPGTSGLVGQALTQGGARPPQDLAAQKAAIANATVDRMLNDKMTYKTTKKLIEKAIKMGKSSEGILEILKGYPDAFPQ